jgi:uncharacterized protein (DUF427 family)
MKAIWQDQVVADCKDVRDVGGYTYFPRSAVRMELLRASPKTESDLACPHGVQFYDICGEGLCSGRSAWSYEAPGPSMRQVDRWIGFWRDVVVK